MAEDDASDEGGMYERGHWEWNDEKNELQFVGADTEVPGDIMLSKGAPTGTIEFRDDIDIYEQSRYKNRYQRKVKPGQREVITVQDVKDVAIFTAPTNIMTEKLINMLHLPTAERFIRALILYCQYYLQIVELLSKRKKILEKKLRTPQSDLIENEYRDNLCDLRLLVAKQYCTIIIGGADTKYYHHMGVRKTKSLTDRDAHLYETFLRMCIQIVWIALGRKQFSIIELEVNRLFKTEIFNSVEHDLHTGYISNMSPEERNVLLGHCVRRGDAKLNTRSPLVNEVLCHRYIDYRLLTLTDVKHDNLTPRLRYLQQALGAPEETFESNKTVVGILGHPRSHYDAMLNLASVRHQQQKSLTHHSGGFLIKPSLSSTCSKFRRSALEVTGVQLFPDINLPPKQADDMYLPESFPSTLLPVRRCNLEQRDRWLNRLSRIHARKSTIC